MCLLFGFVHGTQGVADVTSGKAVAAEHCRLKLRRVIEPLLVGPAVCEEVRVVLHAGPAGQFLVGGGSELAMTLQFQLFQVESLFRGEGFR